MLRPALLRTPLWRTEVRRAAGFLALPTLRRISAFYRATLARNVRVVAVVGTYGKTTTTRAIAAALGCHEGRRPPAYAVIRLRPRDRRSVMEVGIDGPGQMAGHARMARPQVVVVTSIGSEHRERLKTVEGTRSEKADMVRALGPAGVAVLNGDDPNVRWMATQTSAIVRTFGFAAGNDVRATNVALDWPAGTRFVLHAGGERRDVHVRLVGRHLLYPVLAAITVALVEGESLNHTITRLEALAPGANRLQPMSLRGGAVVLRDHCKSSLETVYAALDLLEEIPASRKIVVLGDLERPPVTTMPELEETYDRVGARVAEVADRAVFVHVEPGGPRPRFTRAARAAGMPAEATSETSTVLGAVAALRADVGPGDVVLLEGASQQRFDRIALALAGGGVRCNIQACVARTTCERCPMVDRPWDGPKFAHRR